MIRIPTIASALILAVGLVGCSQPEAAPEPDPLAPTNPAASAPMGEPSGPMGEPTGPITREATLGEPFTYTKILQGEDPVQVSDWEVTLSKAECGLTEIKDADSNPDWDGGKEIPEYIPAEPDEGNEFCMLTWDWANVGTDPGQTDQAGDIVLGEERFAKSSEDADRSWTVMETHLDIDYAAEVNPRGETQSMDVYQIPAGEQATAVWFPAANIYDDSFIRVAIK